MTREIIVQPKMDESSNNFENELSILIQERRWREAFSRFLQKLSGKTLSKLKPEDVVSLDLICQRVLPELLEHNTLWLVNHPSEVKQMLGLLIEAQEVNYHSALTVEQISWLRCLLAIHEAMAGRAERAHEELCLLEKGKEQIPRPNGPFHQRVRSIELSERSSAEFLKLFFEAYADFLRRVGCHEVCNRLQARLSRLLDSIARDERRPGVVQALFYDKEKREGHCAFIHVTTERNSSNNERTLNQPIEYAGPEKDTIDPTMQEAAIYAYQAVDAWLRRSGYPDGMTERIVRWEMGTLRGDTVEFQRHFQGGSIALPLAIAILSQYLVVPVPNDIALTGSFDEATLGRGLVLPVDGVPEKVRCAVTSASKVVYIPTANVPEIQQKSPALQNMINEHDARVVPVEGLDRVCGELFPPEGSGRFKDLLRDSWHNLIRLVLPGKQGVPEILGKPTYITYRPHIILCTILIAALVFLEGWKLHWSFAPDYPNLLAWTRTVLASVVAMLAMFIGFSLPAACLLHRKVWSWYATIAIQAVCFAAIVFILAPMLSNFTSISSFYNAPPVAGLMKDVFVIWVFAWALAANTFNAVAALESLVKKRQFVTAGTCLRWDSPLETRMPIRCVHFPWEWGLIAIAICAAYLIWAELNYYATLDTTTAAGYWEVMLGLGRDLVFLIAIGEVMLFYRKAIADIRRALE